MQTRQTKLNALKRCIEAGTYQTPAEAIVDAVEQHLALHERPIGSLTPEEREVVTRILSYNNDQARQRIQEEDADRLYPVSLCPVHRTLYPIKTGDRKEDCSFCRTRAENAPYRFDDFREESGMVESLASPYDDEDDGAWEEGDIRPFWQTLLASLVVLAATLVGVAWLLLAIHS